MDLNNLTINKIRQGFKKKTFSCEELVKSYLLEIKNKDKSFDTSQDKGINAFITLNANAVEEAKEIDKKISKNEELGELAGVPIAIKDNILVEDLKCTAGSKILENYIAPYNATVVEKLKNAGAIILGKTNMDEFAMGVSGEFSAYGPTKNPHDLSRVPGGSSSGSAASVAADFCPVALGSDTGGSIRQPASFCGLVGLKPSYGAVSRYGLMAMASSLDQIGPIAKNVEDCEIIFNIIKGCDEKDSTSIGISSKLKAQSSKPQLKTKNLKIGLPKEYFSKDLNSEIKKKIDEIVKKLEKFGAEIKEVSLPNTQYALPCYYIIMPAEVSSNLARYDGVRYGKISAKGGSASGGKNQKPKTKNIFDFYKEVKTNYFGLEVKRRIILGTYILSVDYFDAYYLKAQKVRSLIKKDFDEVFKEVDLLITPTTPTSAFKIGEKQNPLDLYLSDIFLVAVNLAGLPAISVPINKNKKELPIGLQIIGQSFCEDNLFKLGKLIESLV